jgi:hypothetical protein
MTQTIIKKNEHFQSMDDMHSLDYEKVGEIRQGYGLRYVADSKGLTSTSANGQKMNVLTLEPVFMVLNPETLSFYMIENINSLMDSFPLKDLKATIITPSNARIQSNHYMTCFKLSVENQRGNEEIICLESRFAAKNWVDAIQSFYQSTLRAPAAGENVAILDKGSVTVATSSSNQFAQLRIKNQQDLEKQTETNEKNLRSIIQSQNLKRNSFLSQALAGYKQKMEEYKKEQLLQEARMKKEEEETEEASN